MAKIKVLGNALTLTSELKSEEIKKAEKFCPEATTLYTEDKEPYFTVKTGEPSASRYGVSFNETNSEGKAYMTIVGIERTADTAKVLREDFGEILINLNKVEEKVQASISELNGKLNSISNSIEIVD